MMAMIGGLIFITGSAITNLTYESSQGQEAGGQVGTSRVHDPKESVGKEFVG